MFHVWWSYRHISSFAESIPTENWIHWNPALKPISSPPRALHFRSPASSRISCCNSSWHGHRWILLKCWFWVHCSICGNLYGTQVPRAAPATLKPSPDMSFQRISPIRAHHLLRNLCLQTLQFLRGTAAPGWSLDSSWGRSLKMMQFHNETFQATKHVLIPIIKCAILPYSTQFQALKT